jgi:hypothetical protein
MQNKANFKICKMNVTSFITNKYENISDWTLGENKPNQSQFGEDAGARGKIQMAGLSQEGYLRCLLKWQD